MKRQQERKCRICRRLGEKLFLKGKRCYNKCPIDKKGAIPPGVHGKKFNRPSFYAQQLNEKQKLQAVYGISESQLKTYFKKARQEKKETDLVLLQLLEMRLDNVLFRMGLVPNRRTGRQLIGHGKVIVDGQKVTIPSFGVKKDQVIALQGKAEEISQIKEVLAEEVTIPTWLKRKALVGIVVRAPQLADIDVKMDLSQVIQFYSR